MNDEMKGYARNDQDYSYNDARHYEELKSQARFLTTTDYRPESTISALTIINDNRLNIVTLLFYDVQSLNKRMVDASKSKKGQDNSGFWGNLMGGIRGMFTSNEKSIADLANEMSKKSVLIEVDTSNPDFKTLQDIYNVPSVPYAIVLQGNKVLYRGVPDEKTSKQLSEIMTPIEEIDVTNHEAFPTIEYNLTAKNNVKQSPISNNTDSDIYQGNLTGNEMSDVVNIAPGK